ncbi:hypothetical protein MTP99_018150 [Tenebrio molitor]|nr:hypothetical protein MTP99_018150 [Tenebrio molitor]
MVALQSTSVTVLLLSIFSSAIIIYAIKFLWGRRWLYYYASKLDGPFAFPLIGSAHLFIGGQEVFLDRLMKIFDKCQSVSKLWLGTHFFAIAANPKDIELVLNNSLEKAWFYKFGKEVLGDGLLLAPVSIWKRHRRTISLTFNPKILNSFLNIFVEHNGVLVDKLEVCCGNRHVDVFPILFQTTLNMICETSLGTEVREMEGTRKYRDWLTRVQSLLTRRLFFFWLHADFIWKLTSLHKEFFSISTGLFDYIGGIVETKRKQNVTLPTIDEDDGLIPKRKVFLDHLIDITDKEQKWTNQELMEEVSMLIFGGSETTALIQSYILVMLAMHQDVQDKVYDEIVAILDGSRPPQAEDLSEMVYLERVIKETMRLFPVVPGVARQLDTDVQLGEHTLPIGSTVLIPILSLHRNPRFWKDPLKFDPDRFLPEEVANRHKYCYLPFSAGPRDCIGKRYAMLSMKTALAIILRQYRLVSTPYKSVADIQLDVSVMTKARNGHKIKMKRRQNWIL